MKLSAAAAFAALGIVVSGCATVTRGTTQPVTVNTSPEQGAQCALINSEGTWYLSTPGTAVVHKTQGDLDITCNKHGYAPGHLTAVSHFTMATAGNVIVGGVVGVGVDAVSGANYYYDSPVYVALGANLATGAASSPIPLTVRCADPQITATLTPDGPDGFVTATVVFDLNSTHDAGSVRVTPAREGSCTVNPLEGIAIRNASFSVASSWSADGKPMAEHADIVQLPPSDAHGLYTFKVKAKDTVETQLKLKFPITYR